VGSSTVPRVCAGVFNIDCCPLSWTERAQSSWKARCAEVYPAVFFQLIVCRLAHVRVRVLQLHISVSTQPPTPHGGLRLGKMDEDRENEGMLIYMQTLFSTSSVALI